MIIFHTLLLRIDHFGPVPLVPFCAMRGSICLIPVVCKKQASQELLLWYGLALYEFASMVSSFSIIWNTVWSINYVAARDCLDFHQLISMYTHARLSLPQACFTPKIAIFRRREWGRDGCHSTSFSIFDFYDMKGLWFKFGHDIFAGFKMPGL